MTVAELVERLLLLDQSARVMFESDDGDEAGDVNRVRQLNVVHTPYSGTKVPEPGRTHSVLQHYRDWYTSVSPDEQHREHRVENVALIG